MFPFLLVTFLIKTNRSVSGNRSKLPPLPLCHQAPRPVPQRFGTLPANARRRQVGKTVEAGDVALDRFDHGEGFVASSRAPIAGSSAGCCRGEWLESFREQEFLNFKCLLVGRPQDSGPNHLPWHGVCGGLLGMCPTMQGQMQCLFSLWTTDTGLCTYNCVCGWNCQNKGSWFFTFVSLALGEFKTCLACQNARRQNLSLQNLKFATSSLSISWTWTCHSYLEAARGFLCKLVWSIASAHVTDFFGSSSEPRVFTTQTCFHLNSQDMTFYSLRGKEWKLHATAKVIHEKVPSEQKMIPESEIGWASMGSEELYSKLSEFFHLGKTFQGIQKLWRRPEGSKTAVAAEISLHPDERIRTSQFCCHPALLDAIIQTGLGWMVVGDFFGDLKGVFTSLGAIRLLRCGENFPRDILTRCDGAQEANGFRLDVEAFDKKDGTLVCSIRNLFFQSMALSSPLVAVALEWKTAQWAQHPCDFGFERWLFIWTGQQGREALPIGKRGAKHLLHFPLETDLQEIDHIVVVTNGVPEQAHLRKFGEQLLILCINKYSYFVQKKGYSSLYFIHSRAAQRYLMPVMVFLHG